MNKMNHEQLYRQATRRYIYGALGAVVTTGIVYVAAVDDWFADSVMLAAFALVLAAVQLVIQLLTFLHLNTEARPRWQTQSFLFTMLTAVIIVVGSIWIMVNLNYNMGMSPEQMDAYMLKQNKKGF